MSIQSTGLAVLLIVTASNAWATTPDPGLSDVPKVITLSPGSRFGGNPIGSYTVFVASAASPVENCLVEIEFSPEADALVAWCVAQTHPLQVGLTNASGEAYFEFFGGGCLNNDGNTTFTSYIAQVRCDGIVFGEPIVASPDVVNSNGRLATQSGVSNCETSAVVLPPPGNPNGRTTTVNIADAVYHTRPIQLGLVNACTNLTEPFNDTVALLDAVHLTPYIQNGNICGCQ